MLCLSYLGHTLQQHVSARIVEHPPQLDEGVELLGGGHAAELTWLVRGVSGLPWLQREKEKREEEEERGEDVVMV